MTLLLDTHVFIWYTTNDPSLDSKTKSQINNPENTVFVSIVSCWEIAIKLGLGMLELSMPIEELLDLSAHGLELLDCSISDVDGYSKLAFPLKDHRDPFDRMIAVQARERDAVLMTADQVFEAYLPFEQVILL